MKAGLFLVIAGLVTAIPLLSQAPGAAPPSEEPPSRVARLNWLSGEVSFQPAGMEEWTSATLNYPLTTSDHLFTGRDSRVELHIGPNAIRLDSGTNFGFLNVDDSIVQVSVTEGSVEIQLHSLDDDDTFEVATPNGAVTLLRAGDYRIDTDPGRDATMLTVRTGQAELFSGASSVLIRARQTAYFQTDQTPNIQTANEPDAFDQFVAEREGNAPVIVTTDSAPASNRPMDRFSDRVSVADLVAEGMTGAEDLAANGTWENTTPFGSTWVPPVDPSWVPYSDGDWAYVEPWGWTWVDAAPWGFAPFHYGRWAYFNLRWVWVPGPRNTPQVYAPALVTFVGGGATDSVSWFPLGPRDQWTPPWRNQTTTPLPPRLSTNRNVPGAIRTLSQSDFVRGGRVQPIAGLAPEGEVLGSSPRVTPVRDSVLVGVVRSRPALLNRPLIARTSPPSAPILFAAKLGLLAQNQGRPPAPRQLDNLRRQLPAATIQRAPVRATVPLVSGPRVPRPTPKTDKTAKPNTTPPGRGNQ